MNNNDTLAYEIGRNPEHAGSVEVKFNMAPPEAVIETLRGMRMTWHHARQCWYGSHVTEDDLREAVEDALAGRKGRFAPGDGRTYRIRYNEAMKSVEVQFDGRPPEAVREALSGIGMRWHKRDGYWYSMYVTEEKARITVERAMQYA